MKIDGKLEIQDVEGQAGNTLLFLIFQLKSRRQIASIEKGRVIFDSSPNHISSHKLFLHIFIVLFLWSVQFSIKKKLYG